MMNPRQIEHKLELPNIRALLVAYLDAAQKRKWYIHFFVPGSDGRYNPGVAVVSSSRVMNYPIVVYPCDEGGFVSEVPALRGCLAQGETLEETLQELIVVRNLWLETAKKHGQKLPDIESAIAKVKALSSV